MMLPSSNENGSPVAQPPQPQPTVCKIGSALQTKLKLSAETMRVLVFGQERIKRDHRRKESTKARLGYTEQTRTSRRTQNHQFAGH